MKREQKIFPEIGTSVGVGNHPDFIEMQVWTKLRMEHEGKWYLQDFLSTSVVNTSSVPEKARPTLSSLVTDTIRHVWYAHQCGFVDLDLVLRDGSCPWVLDDNQQSEEDRIKEILVL